MSDYAIVTDSVLDLDESWFLENNVVWVPLSFTLEGYPTIDDDFGKTIPLPQFYQLLRDGKSVTTSQGTVGHFAEAFERILKQGKDIVYVGFSSALSGSYHSACVAKRIYSHCIPTGAFIALTPNAPPADRRWWFVKRFNVSRRA